MPPTGAEVVLQYRKEVQVTVISGEERLAKQNSWTWSEGVSGGGDTYMDFTIASASGDGEIGSLESCILFVDKALQTANFTIEDNNYVADTIRITSASGDEDPSAEVVLFYNREGVAGIVLESDYDANTILQATADNTPVAITIAEQRLLGRITGGNITDLTAAQIRTLLVLAESDSVKFLDVDATELSNKSGILKIQPNVEGDAEFFGDTDVDDAADGKKLIIRRQAAEGDNLMTLYINELGQSRLTSSGVMNFAASGQMYFIASGNVNLNSSPSGNITLFLYSGVGNNYELQQYGYITAAASKKFISWKVDDATDKFILDREDTNILGFKVNMPLDVAEVANSGGVLKLNAGAEDNVELFGDTDVADNVDGKKLIIHRRAVEGDTFMSLFMNQFNAATINTPGDLFFTSTGSLYFQSFTASAPT